MKKYSTISLYKFDKRIARKHGLKGNTREIVEGLGYKIINYEKLDRLNCSLVEVDRNRITPPDYLIKMTPCWDFNVKANV